MKHYDTNELNQVNKYNDELQRKYDKLEAIAAVIVFAIAAMFGSAFLTFLIASKMVMSRSNRLLWTLMNFLLSIPGFIAFLILNKWPEKNIPIQEINNLTTNKGAV